MKRVSKLLFISTMLLMMFAVTGCGKTKINLNDYIEIDAEGYDSMGVAYFEFDYDEFEEDYEDLIEFDNKDDNEELEELEDLLDSDIELFIESCIKGELDKDSGLSNGDEIKYEWDCDDSVAEEYFNCKLVYSDIEYKVKGLEELPKLRLNDYVTIEATGYSMMGEVTYTFDREGFINAYSDVMSRSTIEKMVAGYIGGTLDKYSGVGNGDKVTYSWHCDDAMIAEHFGYRLVYSDIEYIVEGLQEVEAFNPFDHVEISVVGTVEKNAYLKFTLDYDIPEMQYIRISASKQSYLYNGDVVTIKAQPIGSIDEFVEKFGCVLSVTELEYTVEGLWSYVTKLEEIPADYMTQMTEKGDAVFREYVKKNWNYPENLISVTPIGNYFLVPKEPEYYNYDCNFLYLIYKIKALHPDPEEEFEFYYYVAYKDMLVSPEGTFSVDLESYTKPSSGRFSTESFYKGDLHYIGYETLEGLAEAKIQSQIFSYEYSKNITE